MKPKWQILASLAQKYAHSSFSSLVQSLLPRDTLLRTFLNISLVNNNRIEMVDGYALKETVF